MNQQLNNDIQRNVTPKTNLSNLGMSSQQQPSISQITTPHITTTPINKDVFFS